MFACLLLAAGLAVGEPPHNVVLMIADGAGFAHFAAGRAHGPVVYDDWSVRLAICTVPAGAAYDTARARTDPAWRRDHPTDSSAAITALSTGVKTLNGRLCVDPEDGRITPLAEVMAAAGKATGVVTTVPFDHATPAGFAVSAPDRDDYGLIARRMLHESPLMVIMGAGCPWFDDDGRRRDAPDLAWFGDAALWQDAAGGNGGWTLISTRAAFQALADGPTPLRVLGLAEAAQTLQEQRGGDPLAAPFAVPRNEAVPTLEEMARGALNVVDDDPDGFCLLIEGGAVDWASHHGRYGRMVEEMVDFNQAVAAVVAWLDDRGLLDQTLIVVTADHETGDLARDHFQTDDHTRALVPLFARGPGSERLTALADERDPVRGPYLHNAELGAFLHGAPAR